MMSSDDPPSARLNGSFEPEPSSLPAFLQPLTSKYDKYTRQYQALLDRTAPHSLQRWLTTAGLVAVFLLRIVFSHGVSDAFLSSTMTRG